VTLQVVGEVLQPERLRHLVDRHVLQPPVGGDPDAAEPERPDPSAPDPVERQVGERGHPALVVEVADQPVPQAPGRDQPHAIAGPPVAAPLALRHGIVLGGGVVRIDDDTRERERPEEAVHRRPAGLREMEPQEPVADDHAGESTRAAGPQSATNRTVGSPRSFVPGR